MLPPLYPHYPRTTTVDRTRSTDTHSLLTRGSKPEYALGASDTGTIETSEGPKGAKPIEDVEGYVPEAIGVATDGMQADWTRVPARRDMPTQ